MCNLTILLLALSHEGKWIPWSSLDCAELRGRHIIVLTPEGCRVKSADTQYKCLTLPPLPCVPLLVTKLFSLFISLILAKILTVTQCQKLHPKLRPSYSVWMIIISVIISHKWIFVISQMNLLVCVLAFVGLCILILPLFL